VRFGSECQYFTAETPLARGFFRFAAGGQIVPKGAGKGQLLR